MASGCALCAHACRRVASYQAAALQESMPAVSALCKFHVQMQTIQVSLHLNKHIPHAALHMKQRGGVARASGTSATVRQGRDRQQSQLPRFFLSNQPLSGHGVYNLDSEDSKHLMKVLRLGVGDLVELVDGSGKLQECQVSAIKPVLTVPWAGPQLDLVAACGSLKGGRSDWLIEKATELGAFSVIPLLTENSAQLGGSGVARKSKSKTDDVHSGRLARWQRVATAGMKQSLRTHQLQIAQPWHTDDLVRCIGGGAKALIGAEGGQNVLQALHCILPHESNCWEDNLSNEHRTRVLLVVGPEGDFTEAEQNALVTAGGLLVGLGPLRLRSETAAIALLSAAMLHCSRNRSAQPC